MSAWRKCLLPLVPLYAAGLARKNARFDHGAAECRSLAWPVISVGSLSAGGAGKTPFVIMLAQLMTRQGWAVDVLSRGYGRRSEATERVELAACEPGDAALFGDEPLLIARRAGVPVYVGAERYHAGLLAEQDAPQPTDGARPHVHLLDDGFQHRRLARCVDIVLVTRRDAEDGLLPAGDLREPLRSLRRADIIVVREDEASEVKQAIDRRIAGSPPAFWTVKRKVTICESFSEPLTGRTPEDGTHAETATDSQRPAAPALPLAFCALARPADFAESLLSVGIHPAAMAVFRDHHPYTGADISQLVRRAQVLRADGFVTTEKDAVKLTAQMLASLREVGPIAIAELEVELIGANAAMDSLRSRLSAK